MHHFCLQFVEHLKCIFRAFNTIQMDVLIVLICNIFFKKTELLIKCYFTEKWKIKQNSIDNIWKLSLVHKHKDTAFKWLLLSIHLKQTTPHVNTRHTHINQMLKNIFRWLQMPLCLLSIQVSNLYGSIIV